MNTSRSQPAERGHDKIIKTEVCCDFFCYSEFKVLRDFEVHRFSSDSSVQLFSRKLQGWCSVFTSLWGSGCIAVNETHSQPCCPEHMSPKTPLKASQRTKTSSCCRHTLISSQISVWNIIVILLLFGNKIMCHVWLLRCSTWLLGCFRWFLIDSNKKQKPTLKSLWYSVQTQDHLKNVPVPTFLQNDIALLLARFT